MLDQDDHILKAHSLFLLCEIIWDTDTLCCPSKLGNLTATDTSPVHAGDDPNQGLTIEYVLVLSSFITPLIGLFIQIMSADGSW